MKKLIIPLVAFLGVARAQQEAYANPRLKPQPQVLIKQETFRLPKSAAQSLLLAGQSDSA